MSEASDLGLKLMVEYGATGLPREAYERLSALQQRVEELEAALRSARSDALRDAAKEAQEWGNGRIAQVILALTPPKQ